MGHGSWGHRLILLMIQLARRLMVMIFIPLTIQGLAMNSLNSNLVPSSMNSGTSNANPMQLAGTSCYCCTHGHFCHDSCGGHDQGMDILLGQAVG